MYKLNGLYCGTVIKVISPKDKESITKYQYEYDVHITLDGGAQQTYRCTVMDGWFGSPIDYADHVLDKNYRALVMFINGLPNIGVIVGGSRKAEIKPKVTDGPSFLQHLRQTETEITPDGTYAIRTLDGETGPVASEILLTPDDITLTADKVTGLNEIKIDNANDAVTIKCGDLKITVRGDNSITIAGDATLKVAGDVNLTCSNANVKAKKLKADVLTAEIKASQSVKIDALQISLAGEEGMVLTTMTQPACYVTGAPFIGSTKVKAGS
jgi:hypothetical protein